MKQGKSQRKATWYDFAKLLSFALLMFLCWLLAVGGCHAQGVPLVRAQHDSFVSYYDIETHNPALVVYALEWKHFAGSYKVAGRHFKMDTQLPRPRVKDGDYSNTGFVRGHLCSAGDRDSDKAWLKETYLTSNLVPMTMLCNSGPWKVIEDSCRALAMAGHHLIVGRCPLYYDINRPDRVVLHAGVDIWIPDGFACFARCTSCGITYSSMCYNSGTSDCEPVLHFKRDERILILLTNIIGLWSREEYETITR